MAHKSSSKTTYVTCRAELCEKKIVKQNYKYHLETAHPELDSNDLRSKGQPMLSFSRKRKASSSSEDEGEKLLLSDRSSVVEECVNQCRDVENETMNVVENEPLYTVPNIVSPDGLEDEDHVTNIQRITKPGD